MTLLVTAIRQLRGPLHSISRRGLSSSSALRRAPLLVSPKDYQGLNNPVPLDVSWHMPNSPRDANKEYAQGPRIPLARRFDLDVVAEPKDSPTNPLALGHMMPTPDKFAEACQQLGVERDSHVVLYDSLGVFSSPRAAFTFKAFGHENVSVLDGGLPRWIAEGYETESGAPKQPSPTKYAATAPKVGWVKSYEDIVRNSQATNDVEVVLDHRPLARWSGEAPEPRPGISSGHIPQSRPCPFTSYLVPSTPDHPYSSYLPVEELREVLVRAAGGEAAWRKLVEQNQGLVFTCGSGMTAAVGWLANEIVKEAGLGGAVKTGLYDESWTGYALRPESKIDKVAAA